MASKLTEGAIHGGATGVWLDSGRRSLRSGAVGWDLRLAVGDLGDDGAAGLGGSLDLAVGDLSDDGTAGLGGSLNLAIGDLSNDSTAGLGRSLDLAVGDLGDWGNWSSLDLTVGAVRILVGVR